MPFLLALALGDAGDRPCATVPAQLQGIARALVAGVADGDWTPWERHASDDLLYTTEFGRTMTKQELRGVFQPLPLKERRPVNMRVVGVRSRGDAAVLVYELVAQESAGPERYRVTDTYWRVGGSWRLVASQVGRIEADRRGR